MSKIVLLMCVLALGFGCGDAPKKSGNGNNGSGNNGSGNNGSGNNGSGNNGSVNNTNNGATNNGNNGQNNGQNNGDPTEFCHNANDEEIIWNSDTETPATQCAFDCLDETTVDQECHVDCLSANTGLTEECSSCYTGVADCVLANCIVCLSDFTASECTTCQAEAGCDAGFEECAGVERR